MEIETKFKTDSLESIKEKLIAMGVVFSEELKQIDYWYKLKNKKFETETQRPGSFIIRVRDENGKYSVTSKELTGKTGVWIEYETKIDNPEDMKKMFNQLNLREFIILKKKRIRGKLGEFEICLDDVEGLGKYVEIEVISEDGEEGKRKINDLIEKLGIDEKDVEHRGYVAIIAQDMGIKYEGTGG